VAILVAACRAPSVSLELPPTLVPPLPPAHIELPATLDPKEREIRLKAGQDAVAAYVSQVSAYVQHVTAYSTYLSARRTLAEQASKPTFLAVYQAVVKDVFAPLLATFTAAFLAYCFAKAAAFTLGNRERLKAGVAPESIGSW
jgi:hypothetical protein